MQVGMGVRVVGLGWGSGMWGRTVGLGSGLGAGVGAVGPA